MPLTNRKGRLAYNLLDIAVEIRVAVPWPPTRRPRHVRGQSFDYRAPASEPVVHPGSRAGAPSKTRGQHLRLNKNPSHFFATLTHTRLVSPSTLHSTVVPFSTPSNTAIGSGIVDLTDRETSFCLNAVVVYTLSSFFAIGQLCSTPR